MECPLIPDDDGDLRAIVSRSCNSLSATSSTIIPPSPPSSCLTHLPNTYYNSYCYTPELPNLATIHDIAWNHGQVPSPSSPSPPSSSLLVLGFSLPPTVVVCTPTSHHNVWACLREEWSWLLIEEGNSKLHEDTTSIRRRCGVNHKRGLVDTTKLGSSSLA